MIPDAPWIREAENWGMPPYDDFEPVCPICLKECDTIYLQDGDPIGCEHCIIRVDAYDWCTAHREVPEYD